MGKHKGTVDLIQQNIDAQDRILAALTEANASYAGTRRVLQEVEVQRNETVQQMAQAVELFDSLEARAR